MKLNKKKILLISSCMFLFTGCNLYRQMATPRDCYCGNNMQMATSTPSYSSNYRNNTDITEVSYSETIYANSKVEQYELATH